MVGSVVASAVALLTGLRQLLWMQLCLQKRQLMVGQCLAAVLSVPLAFLVYCKLACSTLLAGVCQRVVAVNDHPAYWLSSTLLAGPPAIRERPSTTAPALVTWRFMVRLGLRNYGLIAA